MKSTKEMHDGMKQLRVLVFFLFAVLALGFSSVCAVKAASKEPALSAPKTEISVGDKITLSVSDASGKTKWASSKKSVASVSSNGVVTAKKPGTATISATIGDVKLSKTITVEKTGIDLHMFDVGQGDAFLFQVNGKNVLVDTGKKSAYTLLASQMDELNVKNVDILILSHVDSDHVGSAANVISDYKVSTIYMPKTDKDTSEATKITEAASKKKVSVINPKKDDKISLGYKASITVLAVDSSTDSNASSLVFRLDYYNNSFLMTGDAPAEVENKVMEEYDLSDIDVLKVAHHGSDCSSPVQYLKTISPKYALISCGADNSYGHPDKTVLTRLEKYTGTVYRTDIDGHVVISGTGKKLSAKKVAAPDNNDKNSSKNNNENEKVAQNSNTGKYIGNLNSKIYHLPSCKSLPKEENRVYFDTKEEAEAAGYRPCKNCKP